MLMSKETRMIADSTSLEGQLLVAMPRMGDSRFEETVIFICAHSNEGAMGFIVNRTMNEPETADFLQKLGIISPRDAMTLPSELANTSLHMGGPVEPGRGFVLHSSDYQAETTLQVADDICLTATLEILRSLAVGKGPRRYIIALGYSGWSSGQLEDEIAANGWLVAPTDESIIYDSDNGSKYLRVMAAMGINPLLISADTGHA
jgi:putative transcriptional regulator